jgi:regulator of RNase E activity RraA
MINMYLGAAYDALRLMGYHHSDFYIDIKPKAGYAGRKTHVIVGEALTTCGRVLPPGVDYEEMDKIRLRIYKPENFKQDKTIVLLQANDSKVAHSGDITSLIYQKLGAAAFITDGNVRDVDMIERMGFPVFCEGENPIDALDYWALTEFQKPIIMKGVSVSPGDMVIAGGEGVIRVKKDDVDDFKEVLSEVIEKEDVVRRHIHASQRHELYDILHDLFDGEGRW